MGRGASWLQSDSQRIWGVFHSGGVSTKEQPQGGKWGPEPEMKKPGYIEEPGFFNDKI